MMAIVLFFMGPSPDMSTLTIVNADHQLRRVQILLPLIASKIETPPDAKRSDGDRGMTPPPSSVMAESQPPVRAPRKLRFNSFGAIVVAGDTVPQEFFRAAFKTSA
jgi:hypothetical protein